MRPNNSSDLYITLGIELGIVREKNDVLELTLLGKSLLSDATWPPYDLLNTKQLELISPELLGHPEN